jgi:hypothetical protein
MLLSLSPLSLSPYLSLSEWYRYENKDKHKFDFVYVWNT